MTAQFPSPNRDQKRRNITQKSLSLTASRGSPGAASEQYYTETVQAAYRSHRFVQQRIAILASDKQEFSLREDRLKARIEALKAEKKAKLEKCQGKLKVKDARIRELKAKLKSGN